MKNKQACSMAVTAVSRQKGVLYRFIEGERDRGKGLPADEKTLYGIASMTKSFVCLSILKMQEEGRLCIGDPVQAHIPEYTGQHTRPGLCHLMSHTAGFYPQKRRTVALAREGKAFAGTDEYRCPSYLDAARAAVARNLDSQTPPFGLIGAPGLYYSYCNDGFGLLSEVIRLEGGCDSFEGYLESRFLSPLGMTRTTVSLDPDTGNAARLYSSGDPQGEGDLDYRNNAYCLPGAGGIKSCLEDLEKLLVFYLKQGEGVIGRSSLTEMMTPRILTGRGAYGFGLEMTGMDGLPVWGHGGSLPGVSSYMLIWPAKDLACAVLCSTEGVPVSYAARCALRLCASLDPVEERPLLPAFALSDCCPENAVGIYCAGEEKGVVIDASAGRLTLDGKPLVFSGRYQAVLREEYTDTIVRFHKNREGRIFALTLGSRMLPRTDKQP